MSSRWPRALSKILLAVTVSMSTGEFVEVQKLSLDEIRTRFKLPPSCDPSLTASNTDLTANQMIVAIECRPKPATAPGPHTPGDRSQPRSGKGS